MSRLFRPFTQGDSSTTRRFGGSGLGLTISRQLARMLGGDVTAQSDIGVGSTFTLTIDPGPIEAAHMVHDSSEVLTENIQERGRAARLDGRVLLVDDGHHNRNILSIYLAQAGVQIDVAEDGRIGCDMALQVMAEGHPYDLVLMDMQMPVLDGYAAARELRDNGYRGPIIALTAHAMAGDRDKCLRAGCTDYLSKPVSRHDLVAMLARFLSTAGDEPAAGPRKEQGASAGAGEPPIGAPDTLVSVGLDEVIRPFLGAFVGELPRRVREMQDLLRQGQLEELVNIVHGLNGTGGLYGFAPITASADRAEQSIRESQPIEQIARRIDELVDLIRRVEGYDAAKAAARTDTP
jgi:CheY-like chemotaxis protein